MDSQELRAAIEAAQADKPEGFEALLESYGSRLYGYFYRATGKRHEAEDLVGEMMLRLVRQLKNYDHRGRFEPWLFRIAANMVRDRIRRIKTRPKPVSLSAESDSGQTLGERMEGPTESVDAASLAAEQSIELQEALEKLDLTTREMVLLRYFGQMSFKELADVFECPVGTALARVHRGLKQLRKVLGDRDE